MAERDLVGDDRTCRRDPVLVVQVGRRRAGAGDPQRGSPGRAAGRARSASAGSRRRQGRSSRGPCRRSTRAARPASPPARTRSCAAASTAAPRSRGRSRRRSRRPRAAGPARQSVQRLVRPDPRHVRDRRARATPTTPAGATRAEQRARRPTRCPRPPRRTARTRATLIELGRTLARSGRWSQPARLSGVEKPTPGQRRDDDVERLGAGCGQRSSSRSRYSSTEPGHPWVSTSGSACGIGRAWRAGRGSVWPSISRHAPAGTAFRRASTRPPVVGAGSH